MSFHIEKTDDKEMRQFSASLVPDKEGGKELYCSSAIDGGSNYKDIDLYLFLQYAEDLNIDMLGLLRFLLVNLSPFLDIPKELAKHKKNFSKDGIKGDSNDPLSHLSYLFKKSTKDVKEGYVRNINSLLSDTIPIVDKDKKKFLSYFTEAPKSSDNGQFLNKISDEDLDAFFEDASSLVLALSYGMFSDPDTAKNKIQNISDDLNLRKILIPAAGRKNKTIDEGTINEIEEVASKVIVKLKMRFRNEKK